MKLIPIFLSTYPYLEPTLQELRKNVIKWNEILNFRADFIIWKRLGE